MYWAAHRVRAPGGEEAIHVFVHRHGADFAWPEDASRLPETDLGDLIRQEIPGIAPGGNEVESYLDVLAPDAAGGMVADAVRRLMDGEGTQSNPFVIAIDGVTVRFGCELRLESQRGQEFRALARAIWPTL